MDNLIIEDALLAEFANEIYRDVENYMQKQASNDKDK